MRKKSQQKQVQSITDPANLVCEMIPFEFKKPGCHPEVREAEFGYVTDLNQFIIFIWLKMKSMITKKYLKKVNAITK